MTHPKDSRHVVFIATGACRRNPLWMATPAISPGLRNLSQPEATSSNGQPSRSHKPVVDEIRGKGGKSSDCPVGWFLHRDPSLCCPPKQARGTIRVQGHSLGRQKYARRLQSRARKECGLKIIPRDRQINLEGWIQTPGQRFHSHALISFV